MASVSTNPTSTSTGVPLPTSELEQTLTQLTSNRAVLGYVLLSRGQPATIIRHSGVIFDGESGKKYAGVISRAVEGVQAGLDELGGPTGTGDNVRDLDAFTRAQAAYSPIRTGRVEVYEDTHQAP